MILLVIISVSLLVPLTRAIDIAVFDSKMTNETKALVIAFSKTNDLSTWPTANLTEIRAGLAKSAEGRNKVFRAANPDIFANLDINEFNSTDSNYNHQIHFTSFIPKDRTKNAPVTVFVCHIGWTLGTEASCFNIVAKLAYTTKTVFVTVQPRLAPEYKYPIPLNDVTFAYTYIHTNARRLLGSARNTKIGIGGISSGGNLAAIVGTYLLSNFVSHQILYAPIADTQTTGAYSEYYGQQYLTTRELNESFISNYLNKPSEGSLPTISVIEAIKIAKKPIPKTYLAVGELEFARNYADRLDDVYSEHKIPHVYHVEPGAVHFTIFFPEICPIAAQNYANSTNDFLKSV